MKRLCAVFLCLIMCCQVIAIPAEALYESVVSESPDTRAGELTIDSDAACTESGHDWQESGRVEATCQQVAGIIYTCTICGEIKTIFGDGEFSEWSETYPEGIDEALIETAIQYRYRDKETITSREPVIEGYELVDTMWQEGREDYMDYVPSWPAGFDTNHSLYSQYNKTPLTNSETDTQKITLVSNNEVGYIYWHWCRGTYASGPIDRKVSDVWTSEFCAFHAFYSTTHPSTLQTVAGGGHLYSNSACCLDSYWYYYTPVARLTYITQDVGYIHSRWTDWSDWSNTAYEATETRQVETRTVYRYAVGGYGDHKYESIVTEPTCTEHGFTTYTCSICGDSYIADEVMKLDHKWDSGVVTKEPTASAPGVKKYTCTVCKATKTEEIVYCNVYRVSGKDRVKTALSVANALLTYRQIEKFDAVIIATGVNEKFADALSGSYLANMKKAPILLYTNSGFSQMNVNFIKERLKAGGTVYILGGTSAIPESVEKTLSAYKVKRLSGKSRYETNLAILKEAGVSGAKEILVATGTNFADSLSASAVGLPLMLVNGKGTGLNAAQIDFLKSVSGKKVTIIGGDSAVSEEVKAAIEAVTGVTVARISGKTRHDTSVLIAQKYFNNPEYALITYAKNFPDGLAGGPLAYAMGAPLLLTSAGQESIANKYISSEGIDKGFVLGGDSAVSDATARKAFGLANGAVIEKAFYTE